MSNRPILFSAPMVRALLAGTKTQTRRIVKPQPPSLRGQKTPWASVEDMLAVCPYGQPGDRLWVRETWAHVPVTAYRCSEGVQQITDPNDRDMAAVYAAGWERSAPGRWRPSIHMPRWASRITLEITGVRVERLQGISRDDAVAEGVQAPACAACSDMRSGCLHPGGPGGRCETFMEGYRTEYRKLWESINGPGSWDANPWVWVVEFKRLPTNHAGRNTP